MAMGEHQAADVLANAKLPAWERTGAVVIAAGPRVHAILAATRTFEADIAGDELLWVKVAAAG